jgi:hypothetical protein
MDMSIEETNNSENGPNSPLAPADARAARPFYKKKRFIIPAALVFLLIIGNALNSGDGAPTVSSPTSEETSTDVAEGGVTPGESPEPEAETPPPSDETPGESNARESASSYLNFSNFSRTGLIDQLEFEGFTPAEAEYGVDAVGADWNEQAAGSAESYLDFSAFSRSGLVDQLEFEGFTAAEAEFGVAATNADWNEQAAKSAEAYLEFSSFSKSGLIDQLVFEGFSSEEAEYGVTQAGF